MNHLAHLALAGESPHLVVGGFLGDFVKGRLDNRFEPGIEAGIRLHRAIDAFTDHNPKVRLAASRFEVHLRRYSGILLDILFDHLLAKEWENYYEDDLEEFSQHVLSLLVENSDHLPPEALEVAIRMHRVNSLSKYGDVRFLENAFENISRRLTRKNPVADAVDSCLALLPDLRQDFQEFYPELMLYCTDWNAP